MCIKEIHWKKASEELPKRSCNVVVITASGLVVDVMYSQRHKKFNASDYGDSFEAASYAFEGVVYWEYKENVVPDDIEEEV